MEEATLFQTDKSVKILVLKGNESLFSIDESKLFGEQLKNYITCVGSFSGKKSNLISAVKPDIIIELAEPKNPSITLDVSSGRVIPCIKNVDENMLKKYHEIFLLINQIKQIKAQLKLD